MEGLNRVIGSLVCGTVHSDVNALKGPASGLQHGGTEVNASVRRLRILIVADRLECAIALGRVVTRLGHDARTAHDGTGGVAMASDFRPDVVLMDIGLPKMDGYEAARHLRDQPWGQGGVVA